MCSSNIIPYSQLHSLKIEFFKSKNFFINTFGLMIGMLFVCILIMSMVLLRVASADDSLLVHAPLNRVDKNLDRPREGKEVIQNASPMDFISPPKALPLQATTKSSAGRTDLSPVVQPISLEDNVDEAAAYLLERNDIKPIYGMWRQAKARPLSRSASVLGGYRILSDYSPKKHFSTIKNHQPLQKNDFDEQMPRPPVPPVAPDKTNKLQFNKADGKQLQDPRPFNYPSASESFSKPTEFKKPSLSFFEQSESEGINNIADIIHQISLNGNNNNFQRQTAAPGIAGLHFPGSFKNLKTGSSFLDFFRPRKKKHLISAAATSALYPPSLSLAAHQKVAMDPFYMYKPRSPHEINLLAMKQQQTIMNHAAKNKKKGKLHAITAANAHNWMILPAYLGGHRHYPLAIDISSNTLLNQQQQQQQAIAQHLQNHSRKANYLKNPIRLAFDIQHPIMVNDLRAAVPQFAPTATATKVQEARIPSTFRLQPQHLYPAGYPPGPAVINTMMNLPPFTPIIGPNNGDFSAIQNSLHPQIIDLSRLPQQQVASNIMYIPQQPVLPTDDPFLPNQLNRYNVNSFPKSASSIPNSYQHTGQPSNDINDRSVTTMTGEDNGTADAVHPIVAEELSEDYVCDLDSNEQEETTQIPPSGKQKNQQLPGTMTAAALFRFPVEDIVKFQAKDAIE